MLGYLDGAACVRLAEESDKSVRLVASILWNDFHVADLAEALEKHDQIALGQVGWNISHENPIGDDAPVSANSIRSSSSGKVCFLRYSRLTFHLLRLDAKESKHIWWSLKFLVKV